MAATPSLLVLPADHLVEDAEAFAARARQAERLAEQGHLVTFGIPPTYPETGFGYIERGEALDAGRLSGRAVHGEAVTGSCRRQ